MDEARLLFSISPGPLHRKFKQREVTGGVVRPPFAVRMDGVRFSKALSGIRRVRDERVHTALVEAAELVMKKLGGDVGFVSSDEVSIVFLRNLPYAGRLFKVVSVSAGMLSSLVSLALSRPLYFDARVVQLENPCETIEYIVYRMRVTGGNYIASLYRRETGIKKFPSIIDMLEVVRDKGHEPWALFGTCLVPSTVRKRGINKLTGEEVEYERRVIERVTGLKSCTERLQTLYGCQGLLVETSYNML